VVQQSGWQTMVGWRWKLDIDRVTRHVRYWKMLDSCMLKFVATSPAETESR
jgi:hypothetical protein